MPTSHRLVLPRLVELGAGAIAKIAPMLASLACHRPLIVTDRMMVELGYVERLTQPLEASGIEYAVFADTQPEPTESSIMAGVEMLRQGLASGEFDCLIALGGGSPIDSAKAMGVLGSFGGQMRDYKVPRDVSEDGLPVIAIPTTAGTGSEVTRFTIITDDQTDEKMLCAGTAFMPVAALVDFELTMSVPPRVTADTGIDALTHAIEAYVSRKANPFSDQQVLAAMRLIAPHLRTAYHHPEDRAAREAMMLGAHLAGVAFSNASVALVHGMSRPIGAFFHVPHGLSNAMLLPTVTEFSIPSAPDRYADCAKAMGIAEAGEDVDMANQRLLAELTALNEELHVPTPAEFGIAESDFLSHLTVMAEQAQASGSPANNPRQPTIDEMVTLYRKVWEARTPGVVV